MASLSSMYNFHDVWDINAPMDITWEAISDSVGWEIWWPGLENATITHHDPNLIGSSVKLTWRSKTGYRLHHRITITSITPEKLIEFQSDGDLVGHGSWTFEPKDDKTHMVINWHVQTSKPWMKQLSVFLRPIFIHNHHSLMKQGAAGLNRYLHTNKA